MRLPGPTHLAFSGGEEFERGVERFSTHVAAILVEEGFNVNHRKTRIMRQDVQQRLAGVAPAEESSKRLFVDIGSLYQTFAESGKIRVVSRSVLKHRRRWILSIRLLRFDPIGSRLKPGDAGNRLTGPQNTSQKALKSAVSEGSFCTICCFDFITGGCGWKGIR